MTTALVQMCQEKAKPKNAVLTNYFKLNENFQYFDVTELWLLAAFTEVTNITL